MDDRGILLNICVVDKYSYINVNIQVIAEMLLFENMNIHRLAFFLYGCIKNEIKTMYILVYNCSQQTVLIII